MIKYNLDTDDVTFSIIKSSNNTFYLVEKIQCMPPCDYYKSKPIYFYEDIGVAPLVTIQNESPLSKVLFTFSDTNSSHEHIIMPLK